MYEDRTAAGRLLGEQLVGRDVRPDVVLAVPPGGVSVARPICDRFDADLGVMVAEPIQRLSPQDLPVGAVTDTGVTWVDEGVLEAFDIEPTRLEVEKQRAFRDARDKHEVYAEVDSNPTPAGTVAIVDEGLVDAIPMNACLSAIGQVADCDPVAAAPVGLPGVVAGLHALADEVVVAETVSVASLYENVYATFDHPMPTGETGSN